MNSAYQRLFLFWKKAFEVELLLLLHRIPIRDGRDDDDDEIRKVNWANWKTLWTFLVECIKTFSRKERDANFIREQSNLLRRENIQKRKFFFHRLASRVEKKSLLKNEFFYYFPCFCYLLSFSCSLSSLLLFFPSFD